MKKMILILMIFICPLTFIVAEETESSIPANFSMGEWNDNVYTNDFLGLKLELPDGWIRYGEEEMAAIMNLGAQALNDDLKKLSKIAEMTTVYYVLANNPATADSISIITEKQILDVTADVYVTALKDALQTASELVTFTNGNISKEEIAGREYSVLTINASSSVSKVIQKYCCCKIGKYMLGILISTKSDEAALKDILKAFK